VPAKEYGKIVFMQIQIIKQLFFFFIILILTMFVGCGPVVVVDHIQGNVTPDVSNGMELTDTTLTFSGKVYDTTKKTVTAVYAIPSDSDFQRKEVTLDSDDCYSIQVPLRTDTTCSEGACLTPNAIYIGVDQGAGTDRFVRYEFIKTGQQSATSQTQTQGSDQQGSAPNDVQQQ